MINIDTELVAHLRLTPTFNTTSQWLPPRTPPIAEARCVVYGLTLWCSPLIASNPDGNDSLEKCIIPKATSL